MRAHGKPGMEWGHMHNYIINVTRVMKGASWGMKGRAMRLFMSLKDMQNIHKPSQVRKGERERERGRSTESSDMNRGKCSKTNVNSVVACSDITELFKCRGQHLV